MKKLSILLAVAFMLLGCQQIQPKKVAETPSALFHSPHGHGGGEAVLARSPVFGISVNGITNGATVSEAPVKISGKVSETAEAVKVNGAPVQNYMAGSGEWSYFASPNSDDFSTGENVFEITAIGPNNLSATVLLSINFEPVE
ncbi:hypothetical protein KKF38_05030 [Patescibacteria group bacterium]|nr:hypothetical protein [Patescibacteria group bacterium]